MNLSQEEIAMTAIIDTLTPYQQIITLVPLLLAVCEQQRLSVAQVKDLMDTAIETYESNLSNR